MRIAYWSYGFILPDYIAADGGYNIRKALFKELYHQGHEIIWMAKPREKNFVFQKNDKKVFNNVVDYIFDIDTKGWFEFNDIQKRFGDFKESSSQTWDWYSQCVKGKVNSWPEVDFLFAEVTVMGLARYNMLSMLEYYTNKKIPCFLWDTDMWGGGFVNMDPKYNIDENYIYLLTPYSVINYPRQIPFYYGYDYEENIDVNSSSKISEFVYVGNDYKRGKKMIKFYKDLPIRIFGNFKKDKENIMDIIGRQKFCGPIPPRDVVKTIGMYAATIQLVPKHYEKVGLMCSRLNEVNNAGSILFMDGDIKDAHKFTLKDQVVLSSNQAQEKLNDIIKNNEFDQRIKDQRSLLPTYKIELSKLWECLKINYNRS